MTEVQPRPSVAGRIRRLGSDDLAEACALLDHDAAVNVFVRHRVGSSRLDPRWFGAELWGWYVNDALASLLHVGANVVPVAADEAAIGGFAEALLTRQVRAASLVGPDTMVRPLWDQLREHWGPARSLRLNQPFMQMTADSVQPVDPRLRPVLLDEFDLYYPACVAMFTEELGFSPEQGNPHAYRARVAQLIQAGWAWAIIENDAVLFKAEVGSAGPRACQIQGVWVDPAVRGRGIAVPAMAALVRQVRRAVAPIVTLYVNSHNTPARRTYERVGFSQTHTFSSVLL